MSYELEACFYICNSIIYYDWLLVFYY